MTTVIDGQEIKGIKSLVIRCHAGRSIEVEIEMVERYLDAELMVEEIGNAGANANTAGLPDPTDQ